MAGMVLGRYFKLVVTQLLDASAGLDQLAARVESLDDAGEYDWAEFTAAVRLAAATVTELDLVSIGKRIVAASKPEFERWGFDSAEAVLTDLDTPFGAAIIDPPEHDRMTTAKYEPGYAVLRAGAVHPPALVEGYLRGVVEMYGGSVNDLACHKVHMDGQPFHLIELRWWTPSRVTRRLSSSPRVRRVA
ncbi:hypothetical protein ENSA5_60750 [Enhygromyxa salina]|uniref:Heme NO-binding domain-containing protein n=1 Tax=Enhygromyxa salina TaxID=215803 RepID=A0A2S9XDE3_9BACT|nr:hypothetical protein [Enhygromyxa salina]PRP90875.1 hypothetical protein ENSA5_60750 [Enhygromyxa salina]